MGAGVWPSSSGTNGCAKRCSEVVALPQKVGRAKTLPSMTCETDRRPASALCHAEAGRCGWG